MRTSANSKVSTAPIGRPVREIMAVCTKHHIAHGEPGNLADFLQSLHGNKLLAMNFWSLVARLSDSKRLAEAGPDWLRAAIVEGVTGQTIPEVAAAGPENELLLARLSRMLAGEDVHCPDVEQPFGPARELNAVPTHHTRTTLESPRKPFRLASIQHDPNRDGDHRPRLLLDAELPYPRSNHRDEEQPRKSNIVIPMASYALANPVGRGVSSRAIGGGLLLLMAIAYGSWIAHHRHDSEWGRLRNSIRAGFASAIATWKETAPGTNSVVHAANTAASLTTQRPTHAPTTSPLAEQAEPAPNHSPSQPHRSSTLSAHIQRDSSPIVRGRIPEGDASEATESVAKADSRIVVPEVLMQANLTSSRVPVYPEAARANHIEGLVVLQAIVSRDGTVGHLRVVQGAPVLRRAAMEAASAWHYRPYRLHGRPVDVSTTISVDFSEIE